MKEIKIWRFSIITLTIIFLFSELFALYCEKYMQNVSVSIDGFERLAVIVIGLSSVMFYAKFKVTRKS